MSPCVVVHKSSLPGGNTELKLFPSTTTAAILLPGRACALKLGCLIGPFEPSSLHTSVRRLALLFFLLFCDILLFEMAGTTSLVSQFDDIVAATGVLCAGTEGGKRNEHY